MSIAIVAAFASLQLLPPPTTAGWRRVVEDDPGGDIWIDPASIGSDGGGIARPVYHLRLDSPRPDGVQAVVGRIRIDCRAGSWGFQTVDLYGPDGSHLGSRGVTEAEVQMSPIAAGTVEAMLRPLACRAEGGQ